MKFISTLLFVLVSTGIFSQQPIQITNNPALDMRPVWTPDGSQLCFVSNRSSDKSSGWYGFSIWNIPAAGGMAEKIEINRQSIHHLDLSPDSDFIVFYDGQNIAFASNRSGNFDIWIKDMESGELVQLTSDPGNEYTPSWSPDGNYLAYMNDVSGTFDIYIIPESGGDAIQFTTHTADDVYPSWSPDGTRIVFSSNRTGNDDVLVKEVGILSADNAIENVNPVLKVFPNPFNSKINIQYSLGSTSRVHLSITDSSGKLIKNLVDKKQHKGLQKITWNGLDEKGNNVPAGNYLCRIIVDKKPQAVKTIKIR